MPVIVQLSAFICTQKSTRIIGVRLFGVMIYAHEMGITQNINNSIVGPFAE